VIDARIAAVALGAADAHRGIGVHRRPIRRGVARNTFRERVLENKEQK
jgi:hypothetical protein